MYVIKINSTPHCISHNRLCNVPSDPCGGVYPNPDSAAYPEAHDLHTHSANPCQSTMSKTFRAVVFHAPNDVRVEDRPFPDLKDWSENDAIVKVTYAGTSNLPGNGN